MLPQSRRVLRKLKKVVKHETDSIWIDFENKQFVRVIDSSEKPTKCNFPRNEPALRGLLGELSTEGYIKIEGNFEYCSLTQLAFHSKSDRMQKIGSFLFTSILTPIVVSIATTLLTLLITSLLSSM